MIMYHKQRGNDFYTILVERIKNDTNGNRRYEVRVFRLSKYGGQSVELSPPIKGIKRPRGKGYTLTNNDCEYNLAFSVLDSVVNQNKRLDVATH